jgi:hypothetical protein
MKFQKSTILIFVILVFFTIFLGIFFLMSFVANGGVISTIRQGEIISKKYNVCLHTKPNGGSGDWIDVFTYYCEAKINWDEKDNFDQPFPKGVLDSTFIDECETASLKDNLNPVSKTLNFKTNIWCRLVGIKPKEELNFKVDEKGEFVSKW